MENSFVYNFHPVTEIYIGSTALEFDPIDEKPLVPANAALDAPPAVNVNQIARRVMGAWKVVADYKGYKGFNAEGIEQSISEIGIEPDPTWTATRPFILAEAIAIKLSEINGGASTALSAITDQYTRIEIDSWPTQETEAKAWTADSAVATPLLDGMVANRAGMDKPTLVTKILANAAAFKALSGAVIGKKQGYEDMLKALTFGKTQPEIDVLTQADIDTIVVSF